MSNCEADLCLYRMQDFSGSTLVRACLLCDGRRYMGVYPQVGMFMRQFTIGFSLFALMLSFASPAKAGRDGVPGRRVGGGTRWTAPQLKQPPSMQGKLSAMVFASRSRLPIALKLRVLYG